MEAQTREPELGMLGCDREVFAQVWSRVAPNGGGMVEPVAAATAAPVPPVAAAAPESPGGDDVEGKRLQSLTMACLEEAAVYQELLRRSRRARGELTELARRKLRQGKRLSAAYFLMTGVRYWPQGAVTTPPPQSFFPVLRQCFLTEGRMAEELERVSRETKDPGLAELYRSLAEEARELTHVIRLIVERET